MFQSVEWYKITHSYNFNNGFKDTLEQLGFGAFASCFILGIWLAKQDYTIDESTMNDLQSLE